MNSYWHTWVVIYIAALTFGIGFLCGVHFGP
jgi:hypothetical protein